MRLIRLIKRTTFGFTLVELLVAMGVIAVLAGAIVAVVNPADYLKKSRDTRRVADLRVIQTALEQAYGNDNSYPAAIPTDGSVFTGSGGIVYLNVTPKDPDSAKIYFYAKDKTCDGGDSTGYILCAKTETSSNSCSYTGGYNYCVTNPF